MSKFEFSLIEYNSKDELDSSIIETKDSDNDNNNNNDPQDEKEQTEQIEFIEDNSVDVLDEKRLQSVLKNIKKDIDEGSNNDGNNNTNISLKGFKKPYNLIAKQSIFPAKIPHNDILSKELIAFRIIEEKNRLSVVSHIPYGNIRVDFKNVIIKFSQNITNDIDNIPLIPKIIPEPPSGQWKVGLDLQSLIFTIDDNSTWNKSTEYTVTIPSDVKLCGKSLSEDYSFSFCTPRIKVVKSFPHDSNSKSFSSTLPILIVFDQKIDKEHLKNSKCINLTTKKQSLTEFEFLTREKVNQIVNKKGIRDYIDILDTIEDDDYWICIQSKEDINRNISKISVSLKDLKSKEGPLLSKTQLIQYNVIKPFTILYCGITSRNVTVYFTNSITDSEQNQDEFKWIPQVTPDLPNGRWYAKGSCLIYELNDGESWRKSTTYSLLFDSKMTSAGGEPLYISEKDNDISYRSTSFTTECNRILSYHQISDNFSCRPIWLFFFSQIIDRQRILDYFKITKKKHKDKKEKEIEVENVNIEDLNTKEFSNYSLHVNEIMNSNSRYVMIRPTIYLKEETDYVLYADYIPSEEGLELSTVHFSNYFKTAKKCKLVDIIFTSPGTNNNKSIKFIFDSYINDTNSNNPYYAEWTPQFHPPPPNGTWNYDTNTSMIFTPRETWKPSTIYTISLPDNARSLYKSRIHFEHKNTKFTTDIIQVVSLYSMTNSPSLTVFPKSPYITIKFDQPVDREKTINNIKVKDKKNNNYPVTLCDIESIKYQGLIPEDTNHDKLMVIKIKPPLVENSSIYLTLYEIIPKDGNISNKNKTKYTIYVLEDFTVTNLEFIDPELIITFSNSISLLLDQPVPFKPKIKPAPPLGFWKLVDKNKLAYIPKEDEWNYECTYTVEIKKDAKSYYDEELSEKYIGKFVPITKSKGQNKVKRNFTCKVLSPIGLPTEYFSNKVQFKLSFSLPLKSDSDFSSLISVVKKGEKEPLKIKWEVVDDYILQSETEVELCNSCQYKIKISDDLSSDSGEKLSDFKKYLFQTPTNRVVESYPPTVFTNAVNVEPLIFIRFSQPITDNIMDKIKLFQLKKKNFSTKGKIEYCDIERVNIDELNHIQDITIYKLIRKYQDMKDRIILVKPSIQLLRNHDYILKIGPHIESNEGPETLNRKTVIRMRCSSVFQVTARSISGKEVDFIFNQPIVPLDHDGSINNLQWKPIMNIKLPIHYSAKWSVINLNTLRFKANKIPTGNGLVITIPEGIESMIGMKLLKDYTYTFDNQGVSFIKYVDFTPRYGYCRFLIQFNYFVIPEDVIQYIKIYKGKTLISNLELINDLDTKYFNGHKIDEGISVVCQATSRLPPDSKLHVRLVKGFKTANGDIPNKDQYYEIRTTRKFKIMKCEMNYESLYIIFNNMIANQNLYNAIRITPDVYIKEIYNSGSSIRIEYSPKSFNQDIHYQVQIANWIKSIYGETIYYEDENEFSTKERIYKFKITPRSFRSSMDHILNNPIYTFNAYDIKNNDKIPFYISSLNYEKYRVIIYRVDPQKHYPKFKNINIKYESDDPVKIGEKVYDEMVEIVDFIPSNRLITSIDISKAFKDDEERLGHILLIAYPPKELHYPNTSPLPSVKVWIQITNLSIDVFSSNNEYICWASEIKSGKSIDKVDVYFLKENTKNFEKVGTSKSGLTSFESNSDGIIMGKRDNDFCIVPDVKRSDFSLDSVSFKKIYHIFDDRSLYKPKETVHIKGYIRQFNLTESKSLTLSIPIMDNIDYFVLDPMGKEVMSGSAKIRENGSFHITFDLKEDINLGTYTVKLNDYIHRFNVQDFKTPQFESRINLMSNNLILYQDIVTIKSENVYYSGGYIDNSKIKWEVASNKGSYSPPGLSDYSFSITEIKGQSNKIDTSNYTYKQLLELKTNEKGDSTINIHLRGNPEPPSPVTLHIQTETTDIVSNSLKANKLLIVHPSEFYVGLKAEDLKYKGPTYVDVIVSDYNGNIIPDIPVNIDVHASLKSSSLSVNSLMIVSSYKPVRFPINRFESLINNQFPELYTITATIRDYKKRKNESTIIIYDPYYYLLSYKYSFFNGIKGYFIHDTINELSIFIKLDKDEYTVGDEAILSIPLRSNRARGILHVVNIKCLKSIDFEVTSENPTVKLKVEESFVPGSKILVKIIEEGNDDLGLRHGETFIKAFPVNCNIKLKVEPEDKIVAPSGKTSISVEVINSSIFDNLESCEVTVFVVDEGVLSLAGYNINHPLSMFFNPANYKHSFLTLRHNSVRKYITQSEFISHLSSSIVEEEEKEKVYLPKNRRRKGRVKRKEMVKKDKRKMALPMRSHLSSQKRFESPIYEYQKEDYGDEEESDEEEEVEEEKEEQIIITRSNFNPLALFSPFNRFDKDGKLKVLLDLPDNLTRYRIYAVASLGSHSFGLGESHLIASLPLQVKVTAPKVLNIRDECNIPVIVQSLINEEMEVEVGIRVKNAKIKGSDCIGYIVNLMPMRRQIIFVPLLCDKIGKITIQVIAKCGSRGDSQEITIDVLKPPTTEGFVMSGSLYRFNDATIVNLNIPDDCLLDLGSLKVSQSSTNIHSLFTSYNKMLNCFYSLVEPLSSKLITLAASLDHLKAFKMDYDVKVVKDSIKYLVKTLGKSRTNYGGFSMWGTNNSESHIFITAHAVHAISLCKEKIFSLFSLSWKKEKEFLKSVINNDNYSFIDRFYSLYALSKLTKDKKYMKIAENFADNILEDYSIECVGLLLSILSGSFFSTTPSTKAKILVNYLETRISDCVNDDLNPYKEYVTHEIFYSTIRSNAIILEAICLSSIESPLIPKLFKFLLKNRINGAWGTTQENAWASVALSTYFKTMEAKTPNFTSYIWINKIFGGQFKFKGRNTSSFNTTIPLSQLNLEVDDQDAEEIVLSEDNDDSSLSEDNDDEETEEYVGKELDNQITIYKNGKGRLYYQLEFEYTPTSLAIPSLSEGFKVQREYYINNNKLVPNDQGIYTVEKDEIIDVVIRINTDGFRNYVAVIDRLPGGLEPIFPQEINKTWFNHYNLFIKGGEVYSRYLEGGEYEFSYKTRAITSGRYLVSPCTAEELYHPDVKGRTSTCLFLIK